VGGAATFFNSTAAIQPQSVSDRGSPLPHRKNRNRLAVWPTKLQTKSPIARNRSINVARLKIEMMMISAPRIKLFSTMRAN
jgi:hypothetical protein